MIRAGIEGIEKHIRSGNAQYRLREELREERDVLRKLKESETKRRRDMGLFVPVEVTMTNITALADSVVCHVQASDGTVLDARELLAAIEADFRRLIGHQKLELDI